MNVYRVMVEGIDVEGGFLTTYEVVGASEEDARRLLMSTLETERWEVAGIEEVELAEDLNPTAGVVVQQATGRAYFDREG